MSSKKKHFKPNDNNLETYLDCIQQTINLTTVHENVGSHAMFAHEKTWKSIIEIFNSVNSSGGKIMFIGNGGSAAIAGHMALDFSNAGKIRAVCFNDGPLLTCLANDYSYEKVFEKAIEMYADNKDLLVAISSSGESRNILNGVIAAKKKNCATVTLSGFKHGNPLMKLGDWNIHIPIPRPNYGLVEVCHYIILHFLLDYMVNKVSQSAPQRRK